MKEGRTLIVGVGNVLRGDDGFGVQAVRNLEGRGELPDGVRVVESGIGGISLVQELFDDWDTLLVLDALQGDGEAGTLSLRALQVADLLSLPLQDRRSFLADTHYANPARALMLAKALDRLPRHVYLLGCVASPAADFGMTMSEPVRRAAEKAAALLWKWLEGSIGLEEITA